MNNESQQPIAHTPGPWYAGILAGPDGEQTVSVGPCEKEVHYEDSVCECWDGNFNALANARFIAAAPRMLELIRELHDFAEPMRHWQFAERGRQAFRDAAVLLGEHGG